MSSVMASTVSENGAEAIGNGVAVADRSGQLSMLDPHKRPDALEFLSDLIRPRFKEVAFRLYPGLSPEQAVATLSRNLSGRDKRKLSLREIDAVLDVLGIEAEERWFAFYNRRRGWKAPEREMEPEAIHRQVGELRGTVTDMAKALSGVVDRLDRINEAMRGRLER